MIPKLVSYVALTLQIEDDVSNVQYIINLKH